MLLDGKFRLDSGGTPRRADELFWMTRQEHTRPSARWTQVLERRFAVLCTYLALTLVMTFPLALTWRSSLPAGAGDIWQNYWNFWWWKQCLLNGWNPLHSPLLFHPFGADLVFYTHSPLNQIVAMPVNLLLGEAAAYNFCLFVALTLSGFGTYLLVRELTGSATSGFLAGLVFAYFPQTIEQTLEHLNLFSLQFIPLTLYYLLRWSRSQLAAHALALGACFGLNALTSWHLGLKLLMLVAPWIAVLAWRNRHRWRAFVGHAFLAATLATLLVLPLVTPMIAIMVEGADYYLKGPVARGIDLSYLLIPPYANPILGSLVTSRYLERAYQASGFVCYLGIVPVALAAIGVWCQRRRAAPWAVVFFAGVVLALGAELLWNGTRYESVTLPFAALRWFPFLENLRVANRFLILAGVGLAVLAGYGWRSLGRKPAWALPLVVVLLLAEYSWLPFPARHVNHSPLLEQIADRPGAVLDIPFHQRNRTVHNMVAQTVHGRPISGGYLSSYPPEIERAIQSEPALKQLSGTPDPTVVFDVGRLRDLGFRTVVFHKQRRQSVRTQMLASAGREALLDRKRLRRLGGIPDATMDNIRNQLDMAVGPAALEDDVLAIYFL